MTLDESTGLGLKKAVAPGPDWPPGPDWLIRRTLAKSLVSFSPCGLPERRLGELLQRNDVPVIAYPINQFPQCVLDVLELVVLASCAGSRSEAPHSPAPKALPQQRSGTMLGMASSETPCTSQRSLILLRMRWAMPESGSPLRPMAPGRSA